MQRALVTGASSGIGREIAKRLETRGYDVTLTGRHLEELEATAAAMTSAQFVLADLSTAQGRKAVTDAVPSVDLLVNAAGFGKWGPFEASDVSDAAAMIEVNCTAPMELSRAYLPGMRAAGSGAILNIASGASFRSDPLAVVYYATKAFLLSMSESLAESLRGTDVRVVAFCPGGFASGFQQVAGFPPGDFSHLPSAVDMADLALAALDEGLPIVLHERFVKLSSLALRHLPPKVARRVVHFLA